MFLQLRSSWENMIDKLSIWINVIITNLPNFLLAIVVFILAYWSSVLIRKSARRPLKKLIKDPSIRSLISSVISIVTISLGLFMALGILNLDTVLKSLLAGAGIAGLAIGLALQGTLSNTFSGIFLAVKDIITLGDFIDTNGFRGTVIEIGLRNTKIKESDNNIVVIPNKDVLERPFKNYGLTQRMRVVVKCGVSFESNLREVREIVIKAIQNNFKQYPDKDIEFHYLEIGESAIIFQARFYVKATKNRSNLEAVSEAIIVVKEALDQHNITIPFPIKTLNINHNSSSDKLASKDDENAALGRNN